MSDNRETCSFDGCDRWAKSKGLCQGHYYQQYRGQELRPLKRQAAERENKLCAVPDCGRLPVAFGLCVSHRNQQKSGNPLTEVRRLNPSRVRDKYGRKHCARCKCWKDPNKFYVNRRQADGLETHCKPCARVKFVVAQFNISEEQYRQMLHNQRGCCRVCGSPPPSGVALHVDHDHRCCPENGKSCGKCVRALLCSGCNTAIGLMRDDPDRLRAAARYLDSF